MDESRLTNRASESLRRARRRGIAASTRAAWSVLGCVVLLSFVFLSAAPASAAASASASAAGGWIRFAQFVPSAAPVDVKVDGSTIATDLAFRGVTGYLMVSAGVHTVVVVSSDASAGAAPIATGHATVPNGGAVTVTAVASTGVKSSAGGSTAGGMALQVFPDDLAAPAPGHANVRVIHTIPGAPRVNAVLTSVIRSSNPSLVLGPVGYGQASSYVSIPAGMYQLKIKALNGETVATGNNWRVFAGDVVSVVVVETSSGPSLEILSDAASTASDPAGGVQTGFGGTAPRSSLAKEAMLPVGLALVFFIALAGLLRGRRPLSVRDLTHHGDAA
jgi:Domain of unknown function (DUF4397)